MGFGCGSGSSGGGGGSGGWVVVCLFWLGDGVAPSLPMAVAGARVLVRVVEMLLVDGSLFLTRI